jgi:hypothetical protein
MCTGRQSAASSSYRRRRPGQGRTLRAAGAVLARSRIIGGSGLNRLRAIVSLFILLVLAGVAAGQPPQGANPNSPLGLWYRSLTQPYTGYTCCSLADCRPVEARLAGDDWEIRVGDRWRAVPRWVVLNRENPDGRPIACLHAGYILCFVPPAAA